ncbi:MAG: glycosyltransferase family 4 protein [Pyrinomonadaceae bacterium]
MPTQVFMKLAYFSPLSPQRSGISDYSEELLPHLAQGADITLFVDGFEPQNQVLLSRFNWHDYRKDSTVLSSLAGYDAVIYHMGNDHRFHSGIFETMRRYPGIVVFHDFALQDFFLGLARQRNDLRYYLDEVSECHGAAERSHAAEYLEHGSVPPHVAMPLSFPLNCCLARAAEGIIAHSQWSLTRLGKVAPGVPVAKINMGVESRHFAAQRAPKSRADQVSIASFGLLIPGKGIEMALKALSAIREAYDFHYTLVGAENHYFDVKSLIRSYNLTDLVTITGHVSLAEFERRIMETDIALNIRERTVGETSASLCRIMMAGIASVVADVSWYAELPNDSVVKIPLDSNSDALLLAYLRRLIEDAPLRARIGANARRYAQTEHAIEHTAAEYLSFVRKVIDRRPQRKLITGISTELSLLGFRASDDYLMRGLATEIATLTRQEENGHSSPSLSSQLPRSPAEPNSSANKETEHPPLPSPGRLPKIEDIDYKQAAIEYLGKLSEERQHHL